MMSSDFDKERFMSDPEYRHKVLKARERKDSTDEWARKQEARKQKKKKMKKKQPKDTTDKKPSWGKAFVWAFSIIFIGFIGVSIIFYSLTDDLPSLRELENPETAEASYVLSRDGKVMDKFYTENRTYVPYDEISPHVIHALVAVEDHRFYDHWGVDTFRTLAIPYYVMKYLITSSGLQGGSTITQQVARNLYKKIGREKTAVRKLKEMLTAVQIEKNYTKQEILEMYLNTVEFSNSAFGIESAAYTHYGLSAAELNLVQAATLVGTANLPYAYNPRLFPKRSKRRRNIVLAQMLKNGYIDQDTFEETAGLPIELDYHPPSKSGRESRYFGEYIRKQISVWAEENNYNLERDGLTIYTTIDSRLQAHAEEAVRTKLDSIQVIFEKEWTSPGGSYMNKYWEKFPGFLNDFIRDTDEYKNAFSKYNLKTEREVFDLLYSKPAFIDSVKRARTRLQSSFTAIDPKSGHVLAWVGGSNYGQKQFDHVYQSYRQAGSTFKPFVYAVAIDNGYMPYYKVSKYPISFKDRLGNFWSPTDEAIPSGPAMVSLRDGLAKSMNNVTVRLLPLIAGAEGTNELEDLQPAAEKIYEMAQDFGIGKGRNTMVVPSIALGTAETSLLELVSAYTTFANKGVHLEPMAITRIEDSEGNIIKEYQVYYSQEVISPETAYIMIDMMRGVITRGTARRLRYTYKVNQDIAGKTGTTQNSADNWFVGMTPDIVMGAWVGGEDRRVRFPQNTWIGQGARTALPIVGTFINLAKNDPKTNWSTETFIPPKGFVMPEDPDANRKDGFEKDKSKGTIGW